MDLPPMLRIALMNELAAVPREELAAAVPGLSCRYRDGSPATGDALVRSQLDVAAYAAFRLPATFAAVHAALAEMRQLLPQWQPESLLDAGAGPGTAMWAAREVWPAISRVTLLERDARMIALGKRLCLRVDDPPAQQAIWQEVDITAEWATEPHDLAIAAYLWGELPAKAQDQLAEKLWSACSGVLILLEPGTPRGFAGLMRVRDRLIAAGATTVAPCPHDRQCPLLEADWCHFSKRIARTMLHRKVKDAALGYEDEKFSYIAMAHRDLSAVAIGGRVIRHPQSRPGRVGLRLCTPDGISDVTVTRKDHAAFRQARELSWGSALPQVPRD
jgi:ribosomal protein RSM22 (predicted rRNA methylase)